MRHVRELTDLGLVTAPVNGGLEDRRRSIAQMVAIVAGVAVVRVEVRSPAEHLAMGPAVWGYQQTWHRDQENHTDGTMMDMDIVCWASRSGTEVRTPVCDVVLEAGHVYRFCNMSHWHRQPVLTAEDFDETTGRWFARAWVL